MLIVCDGTEANVEHVLQSRAARQRPISAMNLRNQAVRCVTNGTVNQPTLIV
jgi:hypothetical protein